MQNCRNVQNEINDIRLTTVASDTVLDAAYEWLCLRRKNWPADSDVWSLRFYWPAEKSRLRDELLSGNYRFEPLNRVTKGDGTVIHIWSARDALVLKALAIVLSTHLPVSKSCVHVKGHGGAKKAVRAVYDHLPTNNFVMRTDVKAYYESIDQHLLLEIRAQHIKDKGVLNLLWQVTRRSSMPINPTATSREGLAKAGARGHATRRPNGLTVASCANRESQQETHPGKKLLRLPCGGRYMPTSIEYTGEHNTAP